MRHALPALLLLLTLPLQAEIKETGFIDFSYCGYHASEDSIPLAEVKASDATVERGGEDDR